MGNQLPRRLAFQAPGRSAGTIQAAPREDGWIYFIHGWTQVISEVFQIDIKGELLEKLSEIAKS